MTIISVAQSSADGAGRVTAPGIGLQYFLDGSQVVRLVPVHGAFDHLGDLDETDGTVQEGLDSDLVGCVHYGRHALAIGDRPVCQSEAAELVKIGFEEGQTG